VILMQENRSSDGSFDTYPNLRGFDDRLERT
jgi:phospholipase C